MIKSYIYFDSGQSLSTHAWLTDWTFEMSQN